MSMQVSHSTVSRVSILVTFTLLGVGVMSSAIHATEVIAQPGAESHLMLAATYGMERRQDRCEDMRDVRQDCREEEGAAGKDNRDCKQEGREDRRDDTNDKNRIIRSPR